MTRFVGADFVQDPEFPIRAFLGADSDINLALALGYLSECKTELSGGGTTYWTQATLREALKALPIRSTTPEPSKDLWGKVYDLCECLETLISTGVSRYQNLRDERGHLLPELRREILENPALRSDIRNLEKFTCNLLWDGHEAITQLRKDLTSFRSELTSSWGACAIHLSYEVAALILDMAAYKNVCLNRKPDGTTKVQQLETIHRDKIRRVGWEHFDSKILLSFDGQNRLFTNDKRFGLFQGLVWELVVPVQLQVLRARCPIFAEFLGSTDLLDFPGVKRAHQSASDALLDLEQLTTEQAPMLLTDVLKRGKTACIVAGYARALAIDGFSILTRLGEPPAHPQQIATGLASWWAHLAPSYQPGINRSPLPLNLVLTFCATVLNKVACSPLKEGGLRPVFEEMLGPLGAWAAPQAVTGTFATNYAQFPEGALTGPPDSLQRARREIVEDPYFAERFDSDMSRQSFSRMLADGGTDYLFEQLTAQLQRSPRQAKLLELETRNAVTVMALLDAVRPPSTGEGDRRRQDVMEWAARLRDRLESRNDEQAVANFSYALRGLFDIDYRRLKPIPEQLGDRHPAFIQNYVDAQFETWRMTRAELCREDGGRQWLTELALADERSLLRILGVFAQAARREDIVHWLLDHFGGLSNAEDCLEARRFLAVRMANAVLINLPACDEAHPSSDDTAALLQNGWTTVEFHPARSPHAISFITPLLKRLDALAEAQFYYARPSQPGDEQLRDLLSRFQG